MGQRTIDTVIRLSSESAYKTALKNCTSELKVHKSELESVTSEYRNNANSMEALTAKGEVLAKMYEAQEQKVGLLRGALEKAQGTRDEEEKKVQSLREQYEQAEKALKAYGDEVDKNSEEYRTQKAELDKLRDSVIQHQAKLDTASRSVNYYSTQLNKAEVELDKITDQQAENIKLLDEAAQATDGCATSIDRYGAAVKESADGTGQASSSVETLANAMVASGIQQKVEELAAAMMECSEASQAFELSVAQVSTISDESVLSTKEMKDGILELSTELRKDAGEVSDAVYNALSAGVETADVLDFTAQSAQLAKAGFTDMGTSVDVLTTVLNAYKLESDQTEKVASTLVKTQDLGKITVDELGKVMGRVIPSAAAYNVNLDNIAAAYANMTAAGINAENTTTYLSTMMDELADGGSAVAGILQEQTGQSFAELMAGGKSLGDVLEILGASVEYDNTAFSNLWSSSTAAKGAISLFDGSAAAFNKTLKEMETSSGTVAKNYEKMTDVSEYSSERFAVAASNLQIVVGDQLNPVLDELREAGAGALEMATDFISENPAVVSAITGVVTAVGLLSAGLAGMTVLQTITPMLTAFNAALAANPAAIVAIGVAGVVAALGTWIAQLETTEEKVDELTVASQTLSKTVSSGNANYEDTVASTQAASDTVSRYIDRLEELEAQGLKTDAQQQEYSMVLEKINSVMPGINAELDAQTDMVKGGTEALRDQAEAWQKAAMAEAAYARYKDDMAALADAEYELAKNQAKLSMAEEEAKPIRDELTRVAEELADAQTELNEVTVVGSNYLGASSQAQVEAQKRVDALTSEYESLSKQLQKSTNNHAALKEAIEYGEQAVSDATLEVEAADAAYQELAGDMQKASEEGIESVEELAQATEEASEDMQAAYEEMLVSARESVDNQIGLFDDLTGKSEKSTADMIAALKSQTEAFENYATNIQLAIERGIDLGLVQQLSDGCAESMQILAELVTGTDEQISELNDAFLGLSEAKDNTAAAMVGVSQAVEDALADSATAAEQGGKNMIDGLIKGVKSRQGAYNSAIKAVALGGQTAYAQANDSHSPSRRYRKLASDDMQGLILQYEAETPKIKKATADVADAGYLSSVRSRMSQIPSMVSAARSAQSQDNSGLYAILQQILTALKMRQYIALNDGLLVGATADAYDTALGTSRFLAERGAK